MFVTVFAADISFINFYSEERALAAAVADIGVFR
jgi:hypothetical protein